MGIEQPVQSVRSPCCCLHRSHGNGDRIAGWTCAKLVLFKIIFCVINAVCVHSYISIFFWFHSNIYSFCLQRTWRFFFSFNLMKITFLWQDMISNHILLRPWKFILNLDLDMAFPYFPLYFIYTPQYYFLFFYYLISYWISRCMRRGVKKQ